MEDDYNYIVTVHMELKPVKSHALKPYNASHQWLVHLILTCI